MGTVSETYNGDCLQWMKDMPSKAFDLAIVDPPYGISVASMRLGGHGRYVSTATRLRKERQARLDFTDWDQEPPGREYFKELFRVSRNQIIWGGNFFDLPPTRCVAVWDKLQSLDCFAQVEVAWTSFDRPSVIYRRGAVGGDNKVKRIHPTQKPVELYGWLLKEFAEEGDVILDTHMGSQSSRIAAYKMGFDYYGCEIDRTYFLDGEKRFRRECLGIEEFKGREYRQTELFG